MQSANYWQMPGGFQRSEICLVPPPPHCLPCKAELLDDHCCCLNIQWQKCLINHQKLAFCESPDSKSMESAAPLFFCLGWSDVSVLCIPPRMVNECRREEDISNWLTTLYGKGCNVVWGCVIFGIVWQWLNRVSWIKLQIAGYYDGCWGASECIWPCTVCLARSARQDSAGNTQFGALGRDSVGEHQLFQAHLSQSSR